MMKLLGSHVKDNAVDNCYAESICLPETMSASLREHNEKWEGTRGEEKSLKMLTKRFHMHPSGCCIPSRSTLCLTRTTLLALTHIPHAAISLAQYQWEVSQKFPRALSMPGKFSKCLWVVLSTTMKRCRTSSTKSASAEAKMSSATTSHWRPSSCLDGECNTAWKKWLTGIEDSFWNIAFVIKRHYKA